MDSIMKLWFFIFLFVAGVFWDSAFGSPDNSLIVFESCDQIDPLDDLQFE